MMTRNSIYLGGLLTAMPHTKQMVADRASNDPQALHEDTALPASASSAIGQEGASSAAAGALEALCAHACIVRAGLLQSRSRAGTYCCMRSVATALSSTSTVTILADTELLSDDAEAAVEGNTADST